MARGGEREEVREIEEVIRRNKEKVIKIKK